MNCADPSGMVARRYEDLEAWQLTDQLKREVYALLSRGTAVRDLRFCDQLRESAASSPRNLAEGFGRLRPTAFVPFVEIAIASAMETQCALKDGVDRGHFKSDDITAALALAERTIQVCTKLLLYLKRSRRRGS